MFKAAREAKDWCLLLLPPWRPAWRWHLLQGHANGIPRLYVDEEQADAVQLQDKTWLPISYCLGCWCCLVAKTKPWPLLPISSFPRRKGALEEQGSSSKDAQRSKVQESQKEYYHVLSFLLCKCPYRSFLNLGVIHFFLCSIFLEGRKNSICPPPPPPYQQKTPAFLGSWVTPEQRGFLLAAVPLLQPRQRSKSLWSHHDWRKGHGVPFASAPVTLHPAQAQRG